MKTTENISLAGFAFTIETDAYAELGTYLTDIRDAFKNDSNADEITSDIEERIAEILREKCISGMVVDMKMIQDVKKRIGNPKELAQEETDPAPKPADEDKQPEQPKKDWKSKRLFRNIDEKVVAGVCSGLAIYFGIDKAIIRLFFLLFTAIPFIGASMLFPVPILYIILWIAMPAARTDDQKRDMKGKPTNLESYRTSDFDFKSEVKDASESPAAKAFTRRAELTREIVSNTQTQAQTRAQRSPPALI